MPVASQAPDAALLEAKSRQRRKLAQRYQALSERKSTLAATAFVPNFRSEGDQGPPLRGAAGAREKMESCLLAMDLLEDLGDTLDTELQELETEMASLQEEMHLLQLQLSESGGQSTPLTVVSIALGGGGPLERLEFSYQVDGARWWPTYTLRMEPGLGQTEWAQEAQVAQRTGEDWKRVPLQLSTAAILGDRRLPQLTSLRLGKVQPQPPSGFRPPPSGLERMFAGYQSWSRGDAVSLELPKSEPLPPPPPPTPPAAPSGALRARRQGAPSTDVADLLRSERPGMIMDRLTEIGGVATAPPSDGFALTMSPAKRRTGPTSDGIPDDDWLDFDRLTLQGPESPRRGHLERAGPDGWSQQRDQNRSEMAARQAVPAHEFDSQYRAAGLAEVPCDGALHRVRVGSAPADLQLVWRCTPSESPQVYREALTRNPFARALLPGTLDVYVEGSLVQSSTLEAVGPGGEARVGLGADERLRVARNVRQEEEKGGLLGDLTAITYHVSIELASSGRLPVTVEVLDRVPVSAEKSVKIKLLASSPAHEDYDQSDRRQPVKGGLRWRVPLAPEQATRIEFSYKVSFPGKQELA